MLFAKICKHSRLEEKRMVRRSVFLWLLLLCLGGSLTHAQTVTPEASPTPAPRVLTIWLPEPLGSAENETAQERFTAQIEAFAATIPNLIVEVRLKKVNDIGGIMATLRSAMSVAPGALPDVTLLRRQDLVAAVRDGLVQSLEGKIPSALLGSLDPALKLGQVNNQLFGVPYLLDLQHVVYRPTADTDYSAWDYAALLARGEPFIFAAARPVGMNDVLYLQYLAASNELNGDNTLLWQPSALRDTLNFYQTARAEEVLNTDILSYAHPDDYLAAFRAGEINTAIFSSTQYWQLLADEPTLRAAPIPTAEGATVSLLNGWLWVIVAPEPEQQLIAQDLITFLMQPANHSAYAQALTMLPAVRQTLVEALPAAVDQAILLNLLDQAVLPLTEGEGGTLATAIQTAFVAVLNGEKTPASAVQTIQTTQSGQ
jgi:ABC-type glycerol-3-phosphate transport system substrate-binding protein